MSPHPLDSIETEIDNYDYCRNQNKIHGRISTEWNDEERTEMNREQKIRVVARTKNVTQQSRT